MKMKKVLAAILAGVLAVSSFAGLASCKKDDSTVTETEQNTDKETGKETGKEEESVGAVTVEELLDKLNKATCYGAEVKATAEVKDMLSAEGQLYYSFGGGAKNIMADAYGKVTMTSGEESQTQYAYGFLRGLVAYGNVFNSEVSSWTAENTLYKFDIENALDGSVYDASSEFWWDYLSGKLDDLDNSFTPELLSERIAEMNAIGEVELAETENGYTLTMNYGEAFYAFATDVKAIIGGVEFTSKVSDILSLEKVKTYIDAATPYLNVKELYDKVKSEIEALTAEGETNGAASEVAQIKEIFDMLPAPTEADTFYSWILKVASTKFTVSDGVEVTFGNMTVESLCTDILGMETDKATFDSSKQEMLDSLDEAIESVKAYLKGLVATVNFNKDKSFTSMNIAYFNDKFPASVDEEGNEVTYSINISVEIKLLYSAHTFTDISKAATEEASTEPEEYPDYEEDEGYTYAA